MKPVPTAPPSSEGVLSGASFADAFMLVVDNQKLDASSAARRVLGRSPGWIRQLMGLRNALVKPFGLRAPKAYNSDSRTIGPFPVISTSPERMVLGFDDRHLDFRVLVDVKDIGDGRQAVTTSTLVKTHNAFGRFYLAVIKPFHRIIVKQMMAQAAHS